MGPRHLPDAKKSWKNVRSYRVFIDLVNELSGGCWRMRKTEKLGKSAKERIRFNLGLGQKIVRPQVCSEGLHRFCLGYFPQNCLSNVYCQASIPAMTRSTQVAQCSSLLVGPASYRLHTVPSCPSHDPVGGLGRSANTLKHSIGKEIWRWLRLRLQKLDKLIKINYWYTDIIYDTIKYAPSVDLLHQCSQISPPIEATPAAPRNEAQDFRLAAVAAGWWVTAEPPDLAYHIDVS